MSVDTHAQRMTGDSSRPHAQPAEPCILVLFGASGDLTKRLLMPALYNLCADKLLPERFALVGIAREELSTEAFRERMTADIHRYTTRQPIDPPVWERLGARLHYTSGDF